VVLLPEISVNGVRERMEDSWRTEKAKYIPIAYNEARASHRLDPEANWKYKCRKVH
jgi:hypothetical protein